VGTPVDLVVGLPQIAAPAPAAIEPVDPRRRREQIVLMEGLLAGAVRNGADDTARQIRAVQPGLPLFTGRAKARGFYLDSYGLFFHVEIPGVQPSVAWILEALERDRNPASRAGIPPALNPNAVNATYTVAVQERLIDAMLDLRMDLRPEEWLTIAAHDGDGPAPGEISEAITLILRVRGSDLLDFRGGRLTLQEARKRVEVREF
jgi:hypothetical protein